MFHFSLPTGNTWGNSFVLTCVESKNDCTSFTLGHLLVHFYLFSFSSFLFFFFFFFSSSPLTHSHTHTAQHIHTFLPSIFSTLYFSLHSLFLLQLLPINCLINLWQGIKERTATHWPGNSLLEQRQSATWTLGTRSVSILVSIHLFLCLSSFSFHCLFFNCCLLLLSAFSFTGDLSTCTSFLSFAWTSSNFSFSHSLTAI